MLTTEDGSARADAESLLSVADALTYHANRGNAAWALLSTAAQEQALRKATDYIQGVYGLRWGGYRVSQTQALDWPRYQVVRRDVLASHVVQYWPSNEVPAGVKRACAELALRASAGDLNPDNSQAIKRKRVEGAVEIEYQDYSTSAPSYPAIDSALGPYLATGGGARLVRG